MVNNQQLTFEGAMMSVQHFLEGVYQRMKDDGLIGILGGYFILLGFFGALYVIAYIITIIVEMF